jgi:putative Mn2+ efflux pump MntP
MHFVAACLLAIFSNVDNLAVGLAYGVKRLRIGLFTNLFIAVVSALATFLAISVGANISEYLPVGIANRLGSAILVAVGVWGILETLKREQKKRKKHARVRQEMQMPIGTSTYSSSATLSTEFHEDLSKDMIQEFSYETYIENPAKADTDRSGYIDIGESIALAFGLALNNLYSGVGAGIAAFSGSLTALLTFGFSVLAISGGYALGKRFGLKLSGLQAGVIAGSLLIVTALYEFFIV